MIDGSHDLINHPFLINDQSFKQLYYLVDGIYPLLSRFVLTISDPSTTLDKQFTKKQESFQKSVEQAFGILKKKFLALSTGMRFYDRDDIFYVVKCAIILHNMMVNERIHLDEIECEENYMDLSRYRPNQTDINKHQSLRQQASHSPHLFDENAMNPDNIRAMADNSFRYNCAAKKWNKLYGISVAINLQDALKRHLYKTSYGDEGLVDCKGISDDFDPLQY
jgi:hypothetical protein